MEFLVSFKNLSWKQFKILFFWFVLFRLLLVKIKHEPFFKIVIKTPSCLYCQSCTGHAGGLLHVKVIDQSVSL